MIVTHKLTMDIVSKEVMPCIHAVQDDRYSRNLELHLYANSLPYPPGEDCHILVRYKKPDRTLGLYDTLPDGTRCWSISGNILTVALAPQVLTVAGDVILWVVLTEGEAELSSFPIRLEVQESIRPTAGSENYLNVTGYLPLPAYCEAGQYLRVLRVDGKGKVTAVEAVNLDVEGMVAAELNTHNISAEAHADIRRELEQKADTTDLPKVFYVRFTKTEDGIILADKTNAQIHAAIQEGLSVMADLEGMILPLAAREGEHSHQFVGSPFPGIHVALSLYDNTVSFDFLELARLDQIPVTLPNPQKLTFTGDIVAEYDGTKAVSVSISKETPFYVQEEADRLAGVVQSRQGVNTLSFLVCSDLHTADNCENSDQMYESIKHCGQAMARIREQVHIDFAAMLGDLPWDTNETPESAMKTIRILNRSMAAAFDGIPNFRARGNHDCLCNQSAQLTEAQIFSFIGIYNSGAVYDENNRLGGYCYRDFPDHKLRVICINTVENSTGAFYVSDAQLSWLETALDLSTLGEGWRSIVLGHHPPDWVSSTSALVQKLRGASGLICVFHGHVHGFKMDMIPNSTILRIAIPNACFGRENEYGQNGVAENAEGTEFGETTTYKKTAGSREDTSFCVVTLDFDKKMIYADHYGAGYDRVSAYDSLPDAPYTVTNLLEGVDTTNPATIAEIGSAYAASLSWGTSKAITSVKVTMGGIDITDTVFYGGHIKIGCVTGDVVITAVAGDLSGNFTNLVPTAMGFNGSGVFNTKGYADGNYVSTVSPYRSATTDGTMVTGLFTYPVFGEGGTRTFTPDTIYLRGVSFDTANTHNRIGLFNEEFECTSCPWPGSNLEDFYNVEQLGFMYYRLTPIINDLGQNMIALANNFCEYVAISANGNGMNVIVTFNEPIV